MGYSPLQALGEVAKGAGDYYGVLASEKIKSERLAEARAFQQEAYEQARADRVDDRIEMEERAEARAIRDRERVLADGKELVDYRKQSELDKFDYKLSKGRELQEEAALPDQTTGAAVGKNKPMSEGDKRLAMRAVEFEEQLTILEDLIDQGFDPSSRMNLLNAAANSNGFTRSFAQDEYKSWRSSGERVIAGILRTDTGAAAPEPEQVRYTEALLPRIGDGPAVRNQKMRMLRIMQANMAHVTDDTADYKSTLQGAIDAAEEWKRENPIKAGNMPTTSSSGSLPDEDVDAFMRATGIITD